MGAHYFRLRNPVGRAGLAILTAAAIALPVFSFPVGMAIDSSGKRKVRGFIIHPIDLKVSQRPAYSCDV